MLSSIAAKALRLATQFILYQQEEEGQGNWTKFLVIASPVIVTIGLLLFSLIIWILMLPSNAIIDFFLPSSIKEVKDNYSYYIQPDSYSTGFVGVYRLPTFTTNISNDYGRRHIFGKWEFHEGIDFPAAFGETVVTIYKGTVVDTGVHKDYGQYIMIKHNGKKKINGSKTFYSFYAHLSKRYVFVGQKLDDGAKIGEVGGDPERHFAGRSTGAHLHLEIRLDGSYASHVNPYDYILRPPDEDDEDDEEDDGDDEDDYNEVKFKM